MMIDCRHYSDKTDAHVDNDIQIVIEAMESGFDVFTALGRNDLVNLKNLLEKDTDDVNKGDQRGRTALHLACCRGMKDAVVMLLGSGAFVSVTDIFGNTPLHWCGHEEIVQILVDAGADVFARNQSGATPQMMAARRGVPQQVLDVFRQYETEMVSEMEPLLADGEPLLSGKDPLLSSQHRQRGEHTGSSCVGQTRERLEQFHSIWYEFSQDLGPHRLIALILTILLLSLYVAFTVTGITKHMESGIPVSGEDVHKVEL